MHEQALLKNNKTKVDIHVYNVCESIKVCIGPKRGNKSAQDSYEATISGAVYYKSGIEPGKSSRMITNQSTMITSLIDFSVAIEKGSSIHQRDSESATSDESCKTSNNSVTREINSSRTTDESND